MNKVIIIWCISALFILKIHAQNNFDVNPTIELWQRLTVSLGDIKYKDFNKKHFSYYNILGSGIVTYITYEKKTIPVIITAKHVLVNKDNKFMDSIRVRFSWVSNLSVFDYLGSNLVLKKDTENYYFVLPDSTIDLACIPLWDLTDSIPKAEFLKILPYNIFAKDVDYFESRDVYVLGYPGSIGSKYWTRGLLRKGIISWLPDAEIETKKFIIDCNVYPGNSGGPVFSFPAPGSVALAKDTAILENKFLGVVVERRLNYNDVIQLNDTSKRIDNTKMLSSESMGVGIVEPAKNVRKLLSYTEELLNKNTKNLK